MAFHVRDLEADQLLRQLQAITGEKLTEAVKKALAERLEREQARRRLLEQDDPRLVMEEIWERLRLVPNRDPRADDEILGYGADGLPS